MTVLSRETGSHRTAALDRAVDLSRVNLDLLALAGLVLISVITHLWSLGSMALHHDESIHAWMSWRFYTGDSGFTCAGGRVASTYCYDPVFHGPSLYLLTLGTFFLFGDGDWQARLPQAIAGILLVASTWELRPYLGRRGALLAGVLLAFSPSLLYFTRFARHDGLMLLWEFWIVVGFFRYIDTGRPRYLYALAAAIGLAVATHELYYILAFIFGWFLIIRLLFELASRRLLTIVLGAIAGVALLVEISIISGLWSGRLTPTLRADGLALLFLSVTFIGVLLIHVWDETRSFSERLAALWHEQRPTLWGALGLLAAIYVLTYSVFFADPRGVIDGLYQGLYYWLGSQQEFARGDQPWYYYLMLLPIYEPVALVLSLGASAYLFTRFRSRAARARAPHEEPAVNGPEAHQHEQGSATTINLARYDLSTARPLYTQPGSPGDVVEQNRSALIFPTFLAFWFFVALVSFSWAGEKMPWLVTHIALPANLLAAWALGALLRSVRWRPLVDRSALLVPPLVLLAIVGVGVALWRFTSTGDDLTGQINRLQGILPLIFAGVAIFSVLTVAQRIGSRLAIALSVLTLVALLGLYTIRATWLVVYDHPDTPIEPLIYVQSSPDVPLIVEEVRTLAINQTRNVRNETDPIGGHTMPVIIDVGDTNGEYSLSWPYQWYLRDFQRIENRNADFFRNATPDSFDVPVPGSTSGEVAPAPVVLVSTPHVTSGTIEALEANYVKRYESKLNWWFPEGNKCRPDEPGYKRFYYSAITYRAAGERSGCSGERSPQEFGSVLRPFLWVFDSSHWGDTLRFLIYRELPAPLQLDGREMQVWVRRDLVGGDVAETATPASAPVKLVAEQVFGGPEVIEQPGGVAVDAEGNLYVADVFNHQVHVFSPEGELLRTIGEFGTGDGQLYEPRGVAVDAEGNLYVADTWNARVAKFDREGTFLIAWGVGEEDFGNGRRVTRTDGTVAGNEARPLGFFGPRGVAVDSEGNVYVADTGNKRIVVTDSEGNYLYQWGTPGSEAGSFNEPVGVAVDPQGNVFVADVWNGRVQVFQRGADERVMPIPSVMWRVSGWQPNSYDDPFVAAGGNGDVYVSVPSRNQILYANLRGDVLLRWGGAGDDLASLRLPSGVAVGPGGDVFVADRGNARVLRFAPPQIQATP